MMNKMRATLSINPDPKTNLTRLKLEGFKNFKDAELSLGQFTVLVGTNASGKSNIRDAFRFLHGISRGYALAEIIGEKYVEGGFLQWRGIRGGTRETTYLGQPNFALEIGFRFRAKEKPSNDVEGTYRIEVFPGQNGDAPRVVKESLNHGSDIMFDSGQQKQEDPEHLVVRIVSGGKYKKAHIEKFISNKPVLTQIQERLSKRDDPKGKEVRLLVDRALLAFSAMRFLDLSPDAMRLPSFPGQTILGDRGENLSSVLQAMCENPARKQTLIQWVRELTPMDASDFEFPADQTGKILVRLIEKDGHGTSAHSASDGTLRFLAMIAALLGPEPARFYFFEELENGMHPSRLHLLLGLIEKKVADGSIQMLASTHSPYLLSLLSPETLKYASLTYRLEEEPNARIKRILDIPEAERVIKEQDLSRLHASGWFEDMVSYLEKDGE
jgi:predicted ATPase